MSRSIFRCFSSCFRFALAAMAAAPWEEAGRAGSRAALRRGPAVPRAALAAVAALRQRAPPVRGSDRCGAPPLDWAGRGTDAAERAVTGHTNRPGGTTAAAATTFSTSCEGGGKTRNGDGKRRPAPDGRWPSVGPRPLLAGRSHCGHAGTWIRAG
jgi:hypothetical protein